MLGYLGGKQIILEVDSMQADAINKLQAEMNGAHNDDYIQTVGKFLLQHIGAHPEDSDKILAQDKSISKSIDAMRSIAQKKKKGNSAMLTPFEGFAAVFEYYGIEKKVDPVLVFSWMQSMIPTSESTPLSSAKESVTNPGSDFDVKLEDFGL